MSGAKEESKFLPSPSKTNNIEIPNVQNAAEGDACASKVADVKPTVVDEYILLHVITSDMSNEMQIRIKPETALFRLKLAYCRRMGFQVNELRFVFDGYRITDDDTARKLGMVNNDVIEIYQEKSGGGMLHLLT